MAFTKELEPTEKDYRKTKRALVLKEWAWNDDDGDPIEDPVEIAAIAITHAFHEHIDITPTPRGLRLTLFGDRGQIDRIFKWEDVFCLDAEESGLYLADTKTTHRILGRIYMVAKALCKIGPKADSALYPHAQ